METGKRILKIMVQVVALTIILCLGLQISLGQEGPKEELNPVEFKAALLSKIPAYIWWPKKTWSHSDDKLVIGILGQDEVAPLLEKLVQGNKVLGHEVVVKTFADSKSIDGCQILFVPAKSLAAWESASKNKSHPGMLTVGESEEFTKLGGAFNLRVNDRKLVINRTNAAKAGLEINSKLLKISIVEK